MYCNPHDIIVQYIKHFQTTKMWKHVQGKSIRCSYW